MIKLVLGSALREGERAGNLIDTELYCPLPVVALQQGGWRYSSVIENCAVKVRIVEQILQDISITNSWNGSVNMFVLGWIQHLEWLISYKYSVIFVYTFKEQHLSPFILISNSDDNCKYSIQQSQRKQLNDLRMEIEWSILQTLSKQNQRGQIRRGFLTL